MVTPKELMISRYEAFVKRDWEYLSHTSLTQSIEELQQTPPLEWLKLEVVDAYDAYVEFKAYYREDKQIKVLHEKSRFVRVDGEWKYSEGKLFNTKIERNEPCPCGSGKKFKKCCA